VWSAMRVEESSRLILKHEGVPYRRRTVHVAKHALPRKRGRRRALSRCGEQDALQVLRDARRVETFL
jgi:hypothetical protein